MTLLSALIQSIAREIPPLNKPALPRDKVKSLLSQLDRIKAGLTQNPSASEPVASPDRVMGNSQPLYNPVQIVEYLRRALLRQKSVPDIDNGIHELQCHIIAPELPEKKFRSMLSKLIHAIQREMHLLNENPFNREKTDNLLNQLDRLKSVLKQKPVSENERMRSVKEPLYFPRRIIKHLRNALLRQKGIQDIDKEIRDIQRGWYQEQLKTFTKMTVAESSFGRDDEEHHDFATYLIYPIMNEPGLRCTVSLPSEPVYHQPEIQINFDGTIDFASIVADLDKGGPGQQLLKKYEAKFMEQINGVLLQMSVIYPNQRFRLRLAGHSLGGALAKGFAHTLQRACALQENSPEEIIERINAGLYTREGHGSCQQNVQSLKEKLQADRDKFKRLDALKKIEGITVYALGAPGISSETDKHGTLLTYYHHPDFLRVYHHFHMEDTIPKFGDCEFLSGKNGVPRILANKAIQFETEITARDEKQQEETLPFPGVSRRVMLAHNKRIYHTPGVHSTVSELRASSHLSEKFVFSPLRHALYDAALFFAKILASIEVVPRYYPFFRTYPTRPLGIPNILGEDHVSKFHKL